MQGLVRSELLLLWLVKWLDVLLLFLAALYLIDRGGWREAAAHSASRPQKKQEGD